MKNTDAIIFLADAGEQGNAHEVQQNSVHHKVLAHTTVNTKVCAKCNKTKFTNEFYASKWSGHKDGLFPICKECKRAYRRSHVDLRKLPTIPSTADDKISPEYTPNQFTKDEARELFRYEPRNGDLIWRSTGKRVFERLASTMVRHGLRNPSVLIDGVPYMLHVLIWNWHHGVTDMAVIWKDGNRLNNRIKNLREVAPVKIYEKPGDGGRRHNRYVTPANLREPIRCPCCFQEVWRPTLEAVADMADLQPMEQRILGAIWAGGGMPVENERIFTAMYQDDPDGGPEAQKMYSALKVGLSYMRGKLRVTGVNVESNGYGRGYRLVLGE